MHVPFQKASGFLSQPQVRLVPDLAVCGCLSSVVRLGLFLLEIMFTLFFSAAALALGFSERYN